MKNNAAGNDRKGVFVIVKTLVGTGSGTVGVPDTGRRLVEYILDAAKEQLQAEVGKNLSLYPTELLADRFLKDDLDRYRRMSPITYVKNMHTPLLIIHSEQDLRCSIEQAEQLFASLKYLGREVLFVRFEGQSHGLSRGGHPKLRAERLRHILDWFGKYLK